MKSKLVIIGLLFTALVTTSCSSLSLEPLTQAEKQEFEKFKWD